MLEKDTDIKRMKKLVRLVKYYDYELHIKGNTSLNEELYDSMRRELEFLEQNYPNNIFPDSPSLYIGHVSASCNKTIKRSTPMLSLRHTYDIVELKTILKDLLKHSSIVVEPKLDGVAVSLNYIDGILDSVSLRGSGDTGEDIMHFAPYLINVPLEIKDFNGEIRGEIIVCKNKITENNRNYVSGFLRRKEAENFDGKFFPYTVLNNEISSQEMALNWLQKYFHIPYYELIKNNDNKLDLIIENMYNKEYEFFIDGLVFKLNDLTINLGITNRYPRNAIAFKRSEKYQSTKVIDIKWSMNRIGSLIPVVLLKQISINGNKISKVHGHNKGYIEKYKIGIDSEVVIARVGDVIPQIVNVTVSTEPVILDKCPFCNKLLEISIMHYKCINEFCKEKLLQQVIYFFNKLKIKNLNSNVLSQFISENENWFHVLNKIILEINNKNWPKTKVEYKIREQWIKNVLSKNYNLVDILLALGIPGLSDSFFQNLKPHQNIDFYIEMFKNKDIIIPNIKEPKIKILKKNNTLVNFLEKYKIEINNLLLLCNLNNDENNN